MDYFWVPATAVFAASFVAPIVNLVRPAWTRLRVAAHALVDVAAVAVLAASLAIGDWVFLADGFAATRAESEIVEAINGAVRISIAIALVITALSALLEVRRLLRMRSN